jgi:hypothetical protein
VELAEDETEVFAFKVLNFSVLRTFMGAGGGGDPQYWVGFNFFPLSYKILPVF